jgi:ABC-type sugar transport system permease subunit
LKLQSLSAPKSSNRQIPSRWEIFKNDLSEKGMLFLFLLPALAFLLIAQAYPLIYSFYFSFIDFSLAKSPLPGGFIGLDNYISAIQDSVFQEALKTSLIFAGVAALFEMLLGLLAAYLLLGESFWMKVWRTVMIMPMVIAPVTVGIIWRMLLNYRTGLVSLALQTVGFAPPNWLAGPDTALAAIIWVDIWQYTPFVMIIYVAALTALPSDPVRAAEVDGASRWQIFWRIILPMLTPVTLLILLFRLIEAIMVLDIVYTLTFGGPGFATHTLSFLIYQQGLRYFNIGFASAQAWLLLGLTLAIAIILILIRNRWQERRFGKE